VVSLAIFRVNIKLWPKKHFFGISWNNFQRQTINYGIKNSTGIQLIKYFKASFEAVHKIFCWHVELIIVLLWQIMAQKDLLQIDKHDTIS